MNISKWMVTTVVGVSAMALLAGCQQTDVIGKFAVTTFDTLSQTPGVQVSQDDTKSAWRVSSPKGEFLQISKDFSNTTVPDLMLEFDAQPFIAAGLKVDQLPKEMYVYDSMMNRLMVHGELGSEAFANAKDATLIDTFKNVVKTHRDRIGYHETLDHYGIGLGEGNMLEWAKDMSQNDKDMVFVLNPEPFIKAGVDPAKVSGWVFAKVEVKNDKGEKVKVDKFLKPYNLK